MALSGDELYLSDGIEGCYYDDDDEHGYDSASYELEIIDDMVLMELARQLDDIPLDKVCANLHLPVSVTNQIHDDVDKPDWVKRYNAIKLWRMMTPNSLVLSKLRKSLLDMESPELCDWLDYVIGNRQIDHKSSLTCNYPINQESPSDVILAHLSRHLEADWGSLCVDLNLPYGIINQLQADVDRSPWMRAFNALKLWRQMTPSDVKIQRLKECLYNIDRHDLVDWLNEMVPMTSSPLSRSPSRAGSNHSLLHYHMTPNDQSEQRHRYENGEVMNRDERPDGDAIKTVPQNTMVYNTPSGRYSDGGRSDTDGSPHHYESLSEIRGPSPKSDVIYSYPRHQYRTDDPHSNSLNTYERTHHRTDQSVAEQRNGVATEYYV